MHCQILSLDAIDMMTRKIVVIFNEMSDADVSPTLISKVTDAAKEPVTERQNWQLDALYTIVYMNCIVVKVRRNCCVINEAVLLASGITTEGHNELPAKNEGVKFRLRVLTELKKPWPSGHLIT